MAIPGPLSQLGGADIHSIGYTNNTDTDTNEQRGQHGHHKQILQQPWIHNNICSGLGPGLKPGHVASRGYPPIKNSKLLSVRSQCSVLVVGS